MNNCSQAANASLVVFAGTCYTATPTPSLRSLPPLAPASTTRHTTSPSRHHLEGGTDIPTTDRLLTVAQAAELLATSECFFGG